MRQRTISITLLLLAAVSVGLLWQNQAPPDEPPAPTTRSDYELTGTRMTQFSPEGKLQYQVRAKHIEHQPEMKRYELTDLELDWLPGTVEAWQMTAARGSLNDERTQLQLSGGVDARHQPNTAATTTDDLTARANGGLARKDIWIAMPDLLLLPNEQRAWTASPTQLKSGIVTGTAIGMDLDLKRATMQLQNEVRNVYAP